MKRALVWIRRDLRTRDHVAWAAATSMTEEVAVVFVFDTNILDALQDRDDRRLTFLRASLDEVDGVLGLHGSALLTRHGDPTEVIPRLAQELGVEAVFTNGDIDPYAIERDAKVAKALKTDGRMLKTYKDHVVFAPDEIVSPKGEPYRQYRPYSTRWLDRLDPERDLAVHDPDHAKLVPVAVLRPHLQSHRLEEIGFVPVPLWLEPGEAAAHGRLERFLDEHVRGYAQDRNVPSTKGVSGLSVHLRHGTLSIREAVRRALQHARTNKVGDGGTKWLGELIWRDHYQMILGRFPYITEQEFDPIYRGIEYPGTDTEYDAWERAETGYPIVDAAMRQFHATGYMHNRLRMISAAFLCKDLLTDYRRGEAYFARYLLDFELASNNQGWQWSASVGPDPQPFFRVFNPTLQAQKFDPDGDFVREWIPELARLDAKSIHAPWESSLTLKGYGIVLGRDYPKPIVDHAERRDRAIELLRAAREKAASASES